jgi:hypothetical protein
MLYLFYSCLLYVPDGQGSYYTTTIGPLSRFYDGSYQ